MKLRLWIVYFRCVCFRFRCVSGIVFQCLFAASFCQMSNILEAFRTHTNNSQFLNAHYWSKSISFGCQLAHHSFVWLLYGAWACFGDGHGLGCIRLHCLVFQSFTFLNGLRRFVWAIENEIGAAILGLFIRNVNSTLKEGRHCVRYTNR